MAYYSPYITGEYSPLYIANKQGFGHCSNELPTKFGTWRRDILK